MSEILKKIYRVIDRISRILGFLAGAIIIFLLIAVVADVVLRYFFNSPIEWVPEYSEYSLLYITFLGTAWVLLEKGHVNIDLALTRLNPRAQAMANTINYLVAAIVFLIVTWFGLKVTLDMLQTNYLYDTPLKTPRFIVLAVIPLGSALLFLLLIKNTWEYFMNWRHMDKGATRS